MDKLNYSRNGKTYSLDKDGLSEESRDYLMQYGFAQSLQDSIAGLQARTEKEILEESPDLAEDEIQAKVLEAIDARLLKRLDAIIAGMQVQTRESRDPFASECKKVAIEGLKAYAKAKGKKLPKVGSDEYDSMLEKYSTHFAEKIKESARKRLDEKKAMGELDFSL